MLSFDFVGLTLAGILTAVSILISLNVPIVWRATEVRKGNLRLAVLLSLLLLAGFMAIVFALLGLHLLAIGGSVYWLNIFYTASIVLTIVVALFLLVLYIVILAAYAGKGGAHGNQQDAAERR